MIFRIDSHQASLLTREELPVSHWAEKLDRFIQLTSYPDEKELISELELEYHLDVKQLTEIRQLLEKEQVPYLRFSYSKYEHFKIAPVSLSIKDLEGTLIYWNDWDYMFRRVGTDYYLWCFLGGIADIQREIKLSEEQVRKYQETGLAQIDYLIADLKRLNDSVTYPQAIEENRRIL